MQSDNAAPAEVNVSSAAAEVVDRIAPTVEPTERATLKDSKDGFMTERHRITDAALESTLRRAADASIDRQDRDERNNNPRMPAPMAAKDAGGMIDRTAEWLEMPLSERKALSQAHEDIQQRRQEADRLGLTLVEREALLAGAREQQPQAMPADVAEFQPVRETLQQLYPEHKPADVAQRYADIDAYLRRDTRGALRWLASEFGVDPREVFGQQQQQATAYSDNASRKAIIADFLKAAPDLKQFEDDMLEADRSGAVKATGDFAKDLRAFYDYAKSNRSRGRGGKPENKGKDWQATLQRVGERLAARDGAA